MDSKGFDGFFAPAPANVPTAAPPVAPPVTPAVAPPVVAPVIPRDEPAFIAAAPPEPPIVDAGLGEASSSPSAVRAVQDSVRQGESLSKPLTHHPVFPPMVVQMMSVGEDTGALDSMLLKISDFYDDEVERTTESLTALIEPLMIAFLGGLVGSMIIALYMPIFKVFTLIE